MDNLIKALEFYAYEAKKELGIFGRGTLWDEDMGKVAREALNNQRKSSFDMGDIVEIDGEFWVCICRDFHNNLATFKKHDGEGVS